MSEQIASFVPGIPWDDETTEPIDRSTLQGWTECPAQARLKEKGQGHAGLAAATGTEIHTAIGHAIQDYLDEWERMGKADLARQIELHAQHARPDVQPGVMDGLGAWIAAQVIQDLPFGGIMRFDGGQGDKSGQLAWDLDDVRLTGEVDLLTATPSPDLLESYDWKSGWTQYTVERVAADFQFDMYAWLILKNYPEVEQVDVKVVMTRKRHISPRVSIRRDRDLKRIEGRLRTAVSTYRQWRGRDDAPAWPAPEKCRWCDVALQCPVFALANPNSALIRQDPAVAVDTLVALEKIVEAMHNELTAVLEQRDGSPIQGHSGARYGYAKPSPRKVKPKLM